MPSIQDLIDGSDGQGITTVFGLNPDGTVDRSDNGKGYYGYNTRDPSLVGVSLPRSVILKNFGDEDAASGTVVQVTNPATGRTLKAPLVDIGPGESTGHAMDLTYGAMQKLGGTGRDHMVYKIVKPGGDLPSEDEINSFLGAKQTSAPVAAAALPSDDEINSFIGADLAPPANTPAAAVAATAPAQSAASFPQDQSFTPVQAVQGAPKKDYRAILKAAADAGDPSAQILEHIAQVTSPEALQSSTEAYPKEGMSMVGGDPSLMPGSLGEAAQRGLLKSPFEGALPRPEGDGAIAGTVRGAEKFAEGLGSPLNLTLGAVLPGAPSLLQKGVAAYFAGSMAKEVPSQLIAAHNAPTTGQAAELYTEAGLNALMAGLAGTHALGRPGIGGLLPGEEPIWVKTPDGKTVQVAPGRIDTDLKIAPTPQGLVKLTPDGAIPLSRTETESAAALKGPEILSAPEPAPSPVTDSKQKISSPVDPRGGLSLKEWIQKRVSEGSGRDEAMQEFTDAKNSANDWLGSLKLGAVVESKDGIKYTKESDGTLRSKNGAVYSGTTFDFKLSSDSEAPAQKGVTAITPEGKPTLLTPTQQGPHIISTVLDEGDGKYLVGDKWNSPHQEGENSIFKRNIENASGVGDSAFAIQDEAGDIRVTQDRREAARIADQAGQRPPEITGPLQSQDLRVSPHNDLRTISGDTFERESGEPLREGNIAYRDAKSLQVIQAPPDAPITELNAKLAEVRKQEEGAQNIARYEQSLPQQMAFDTDKEGNLVPKPKSEIPTAQASPEVRQQLGERAVASLTQGALFNNPDRLEQLKADILSQHAKAKVPLAEESVQRAVAAIDERLAQLRAPKEPAPPLAFSKPPEVQGHAAIAEEAPPVKPQISGYVQPPEPPQASVGTTTPEEPIGGPTSIKNAVTDTERSARGISPADAVTKRTFPEVWEGAKRAAEADPSLAPKLVDELNKKPRAITDSEDALLLRHQVETQNRYNDAIRDFNEARASGDDAAIADARARILDNRDQLQKIYEADRKAGTETARGLNARKMVANEDFTLGKMLSEREAAKGNDLSLAEKDQVQKEFEKIQEAKSKVDQAEVGLNQKRSDKAAEKAVSDLGKEVRQERQKPSVSRSKIGKVSESVTKLLDQQAEAARQRILERRGKAFSNPLAPFAHVADEAIIGASYLAHGIEDFGKWSAEMLREFGKGIAPKLRDFYEQSRNYLEGSGNLQSLSDKLSARVKDGESFEQVKALVPRMAKELVRTGISERQPLVDAVHDQLKGQFPDLTKRQVQDAISGYGDTTKLSKDAVSVKLRDLKGQLQQVSKIEDMQKKQAPLKTGLERRVPSAEERALLKEVNKLKKEGGYEVKSPEDQLKSSLDGIKTRLTNQIEDLQRAIDKKEPIASSKGPSPTNPEVEALKVQRDSLKAQYDQIFPKKGLTDEQRVKAATAALEKSIADYQERIKSGNYAPKPKGIPISTNELEALRAKRDAAKEELSTLREASAAHQAEQQAKRATALQSQISELDRRLKEGDITSKPGAPKTEATDALQDLRSQRDAMAQKLAELQRDAKRPSPNVLAARENERQIAAAKKSIADLDQRLKTGDISTKSQPPKTVSPELEALRSERDSMSKQLQDLRNEAKPRKSPEEIALQSAKTRTRNAIADLQDKLAKGDFTKERKSTPIQPDAELTKARLQYEDLKQQWATGNLKLERANRPAWQKGLDFVSQWGRFSLLSNPAILGKLALASVYRYGSTLAEAAPGSLIRTLFPKLAEKAPYEGGKLNYGQEVKSLTQGIIKGVRDIPRILVTHGGERDTLYGKKMAEVRNPWLDWAGSMHAALKSPIKQVIWERSFARRMEHADRHGIDVSQPEVQMRIGKEAYEDSQRAIFQQDSKIASGIKALIKTWESPEKATGKPTLGGKLAATGARVLLPIQRVPVNIVGEALEYATGLERGGFKLASAFKNGLENLQPSEADQIMRYLKKGSIGSAIMLAAFLRPQNVGGYFVKGQKSPSNQPQPGEMKVGDTTLPRAALHTPMMDAANLAATMRKTSDARVSKKAAGTKGIGEGITAAILGLAEETPYVSELFRLGQIQEPGGAAKYAGELAASRIVPGAARYAARLSDTSPITPSSILSPTPQKRVPQNFGQRLEQDIPGLRQQVTTKASQDLQKQLQKHPR